MPLRRFELAIEQRIEKYLVENANIYAFAIGKSKPLSQIIDK